MNTTADKLNRLTETKNAIKTAITAKGGAVNDAMTFREYANAIMGIPQEGGGGGSGIIDVTELPTENIDENAVYKVTTNQEQQVYVIEDGQIYTVEQYATLMGFACYKYWVDELPNNMEVTNTELHLYVLSSNGIGYVAFGSSTNIVPIGQLLFGSAEYDRGYTDNIADETFNGVYVTRETNKEDWFIRENGEWKRISADEQTKLVTLIMPGTLQIKPDEGKLLSVITVSTGFPTVADFISNNTIAFENITEACFVDSQGNNISTLRSYAFANSYVKYAVIPDFVTDLKNRTFENCDQLKQVTFLGKPSDLETNVFTGCYRLTTINVPWSEGEVAGAPWGATNATINYNYTEG